MTAASAGTRAPAVADAAGDGGLLHAFSVALAIWTFGLLSAGGVVTGKEAGLAVPDWPLSYGHVNPPGWTIPDNVFVEHLHRLLGWAAGLMTIALAVWVQLRDPRPWMRRLGWIVLGAIVVQGVIGGYFRVVLLQHGMAIVHGITGQAFFCLVVATALFLSPGWRDAPPAAEDPSARRLRRLSLLAAVALFLQVVIGAVVRHSRLGHSIAHVAPHALWGLVAAGLSLSALLEASRVRGARGALLPPALVLGGGAALQVLLGLGAYFANTVGVREIVRPTTQVVTTTIHQAAGAAVLAAAVVLHLRARRLLREPAAGPAPAGAAA
jgi:cytochrome c oxidase assembly protein subunit 15